MEDFNIQKKEKMSKKYEAKREYYLIEIEKNRMNYFANNEKKQHSNQPICAIVHFRSMEGCKRAIKSFKINACAQIFYYLCCCCRSKRYDDVLFQNRFLKVQPAVEPDLMLWENFGISKKNRCVRIVLYIIFVVSILLICFYSILVLESWI